MFSRLAPFKLNLSVFTFYRVKPSAVRVKEYQLPFRADGFTGDNSPDSPKFYWFESVSKGKCQSPKSRLVHAVKANCRLWVTMTTGTLAGFICFNAVFHQNTNSIAYTRVKPIPVKFYLIGQIGFTRFHVN